MPNTTPTFATAAEVVAHSFDNTTVYRRRERVDMAAVMIAAADLLGCSLAELRTPDGTADWERGAQAMLDAGLDTVAAINTHCDALTAARWKRYREQAEAADLAQAEYSHHVSGCDANGMELMETVPFSDMGMYASVPDMAAAQEWAATAFANDARVQQVHVSIYRRTPNSVGWVFHKGVTTIHRPA